MDEWTEREAREEITRLKKWVKDLKAELKAEEHRGLETRAQLEAAKAEVTLLKSMKPSFRTTEKGNCDDT